MNLWTGTVLLSGAALMIVGVYRHHKNPESSMSIGDMIIGGALIIVGLMMDR